MQSKTKSIGTFIKLADNRNSELKVTNLLGMNIKKEFMPSVANTSGTDLSKYKIIQEGQFAYSSMQTGRDETIRVALYSQDEPAIISPAYSVFEVIDKDLILPEFIMMWFLRPESDRYGWFISDASVRASLDWERFCEIELPVPSIEEQKKCVSLYNGLIKNQQCYENSLNDLRLICEIFFEDQIKKVNKVQLGPYIQQTEEQNSDSSNRNLLGISINKVFIPSRANRKDLNVSNYKVVKNRQFACNIMHVGRDERLPIALYTGTEQSIVSPAYKTFGVRDKNEVLPEYLMIYFQRGEFDRFMWYLCDSSIRGGLDWERFCEIELPVPSIEKQQSIVAIHHVLETRKRLNERLKETIRLLCTILMQGVIKDLKAREVQEV